MKQRFTRLCRCNDFRKNPVRALVRRMLWKVRWRILAEPWRLKLGEYHTILVPRGGAGALIYYQGYSEPETANLILNFLRSGMVFMDIGAHIGEYTLLAAEAVKSQGEVHAFEPNPEIYQLLCKNVQLNNFSNSVLNECAVSDFDGEREFEICAEPSVSSLLTSKNLDNNRQRKVVKKTTVPSVSMDTYWSKFKKKIDLIKVDVEGAEKMVFEGASKLLALSPNESPNWIFEFQPNNLSRFGCRPDELFDLLQRHRYKIWQYNELCKFIPFNPNLKQAVTKNLFASKNDTIILNTMDH